MRLLIPILIVLALATGFGFVLADHPGRASLDWAGWRVDTSAAAVLVLLFGLSLLLAALWRLVGWLAGAPARGERARTETRRRQALETLSRGFLSLAAGDVPEAARQARRALALNGAAPELSQLLAGQAAEASGDDAGAQAAYAALLTMADGRAAGQRGLRRLALRRGEALQATPGPSVDPPPPPPDPPLSLDR